MHYCESFMKRYIGVYNYVTYIIGASLKKVIKRSEKNV